MTTRRLLTYKTAQTPIGRVKDFATIEYFNIRFRCWQLMPALGSEGVVAAVSRADGAGWSARREAIYFSSPAIPVAVVVEETLR